MLVPFPIAFLVGALASDIVFFATRDPFWARMSIWLVGAGFATGVVAAVIGLTDFLFIRRVRALRAAWIHFGINAVVLLLSLWNLALRLDAGTAAVPQTGLILSIVVTLLLLVTGWYGGELAYRHKIGAVDGLPTGIDAAESSQPAPIGMREAQAQAESERDRHHG